MRRGGAGLAGWAAVVTLFAPAGWAQTEPRVAVWYRGTPAGVPVQNELALARALGFSAIVWPGEDPGPTRRLEAMAAVVGLDVMTPADAGREPGRWRNEVPAGASPALMVARVWLAIAAGARTVTFDSDEPTGAGLTDQSGALAPWVAAALALNRQISANAELLGHLGPGPPIEVDQAGDSSARIVLLDGGRAWLLVAANPSAAAAAFVARFPKAVPYGPWVSLIDGTDMAMVDRAADHEYRVTLPPGDARVYVIDKRPAASW